MLVIDVTPCTAPPRRGPAIENRARQPDTTPVDAIHRILDRGSIGRQSELRVPRRGEVATARITPERRPEERGR